MMYIRIIYNVMIKTILSLSMVLLSMAAHAQADVETHRQYLSGRGCDDMVQWDFYCTGGRNAGHWTKIGVPSCWELQGFGTYQYGMRFYGKAKPEGIANEKGMYRYEFALPQEWQGRQIQLVFEAAMTDALVTINGRKAGDTHQGGFYRFMYDVSDRVFFGKKKNRLEVTVSKESENTQVNMAERRADYWNFGGIFRPVFVVSKPVQNIARVAIDGGMDGRFVADCFLNRAVAGAKVQVEIVDKVGRVAGKSVFDTRGSDRVKVDFRITNPALWTAETPHLYTAVFSLQTSGGKTMHVHRERFGFRTIEIRQRDGVYINGTKVVFKGVNRHSFRPETGRTLSKEKNIEDVKIIKSMNMNAVRLSHYPADPEFLEACDSLGLYVENELSGWHWAHETVVGQKLVRELVTRDVNHPSVIFWSNGNEGGFNYELEPEFAKWDIQKRVVIYPWANRNGIETKHYRSWGETQEYMRQPEIFMPTEFLHGLYDGGHGAGLKDYWEMMMGNPRCAGGFLWDFADAGVVRTDMDGVIDCQGNFGADGILGPHMEKEGSYYTIKEVWSPVQLVRRGDTLLVENRYDFLNLNTCRLAYRYSQMPAAGASTVKTLREGALQRIDAAPHGKAAVLDVPVERTADVLSITATDMYGSELFTWSFANPYRAAAAQGVEPVGSGKARVEQTEGTLTVNSEGRSYRFSRSTGYLEQVAVGSRTLSFGGGPRFIAARRSDRSFDQFYNHDDKTAEKKKTQYTLYADQGRFAGFDVTERQGCTVLTARYGEGSLDSVTWRFGGGGSVAVDCYYRFGGVVDEMGVMFDYPEPKMKSKAWVGNGPYRVWQNRLEGPQYGYWRTDYNDPVPGESFSYPEFKGYFSGVDWMQFDTDEGRILLKNRSNGQYVGVYQPRDGRDQLLYELPASGISLLRVIPPVRNKVNTTDLTGPSAQPFWAKNEPVRASMTLRFE